jgi:C1A family cysteine protease
MQGRFEIQAAIEPSLVQLYVRQYGGVVTRIRVYPHLYDFFRRQPKGVYPGPSPAALKGQAVEHAVVVVGYDNQAGFWLVRNSWGARWGDGGYFRVRGDC